MMNISSLRTFLSKMTLKPSQKFFKSFSQFFKQKYSKELFKLSTPRFKKNILLQMMTAKLSGFQKKHRSIVVVITFQKKMDSIFQNLPGYVQEQYCYCYSSSPWSCCSNHHDRCGNYFFFRCVDVVRTPPNRQ